MPESLQNRRVTVMGLGRFGGGVGVARWLCSQGARILVTDKDTPESLAESVAALDGCDVLWKLGGHDQRDFIDTDLVVVNPAVPNTAPQLAAARDAGVPITSEINLFVERCPAVTVGITGSVGKSTTTAMLGHVLERTYDAGRTWVGGNLGRSLLMDLPQMSAGDVVVLELSSFQLQRTPLVRWSPHIALITNISPNHLDWHGNYAAYAAAKLGIVRFQRPERDHIIAGDTPELCRHFDLLFGDKSGVWRYSLDGETPVAVCQSTAAIDCDDLRAAWPHLTLRTPGAHNRLNAAGALTAAKLLGIEPNAAVAALADFAGLPDRLEFVAEHRGIAFYNDSKASTPAAACVAIQSMDRPLCLILGGYDKHIDLSPVTSAAAHEAKFVACIGEVGQAMCDAVRRAGGGAQTYANLDEAVDACIVHAESGDAVLLSPACASWDQFRDYRQRGARFRERVQTWIESAR